MLGNGRGQRSQFDYAYCVLQAKNGLVSSMGRSIGGAVVGLITYSAGMAILAIVLMFILGAEGIVDSDKNPTTMWLVSGSVLVLVVSYLGSAVARAIGKDKLAVFIFGGIMILLGIVGMFTSGSGEPPEIDPQTPESVKAFVEAGEAAYYAGANAPSWSPFASLLFAIIGIALGGLKKGDFGKPGAPAPEDDASSES